MKVVMFLLFCILVFVSIMLDRNFEPTTKLQQEEAIQNLAEAGQPIPPSPFASDGCTLFPDKIGALNLKLACFEHDRAYWSGGTVAEKKVADLALKEAIITQGFFGQVVGHIVYAGVTFFGDTWLTKLFNANWGFGWNK